MCSMYGRLSDKLLCDLCKDYGKKNMDINKVELCKIFYDGGWLSGPVSQPMGWNSKENLLGAAGC